MREKLQAKIKEVVSEIFDVEVEPVISVPEEQFGDYSTNVALQLADQNHKAPHEIADKIAKSLQEKLSDDAESVDIAEPGFINIRLSVSALWERANETETYKPMTYKDQSIVIETNNPNPFKDLHIGHAYNSVVGDTISNLLGLGQAKVHRVSYHGDVGLHVGKSMWAILRFIDGDPDKLKTIPETKRPTFLSQKYLEGSTAYEEDASAKKEIEDLSQQSFVLDDPIFKTVYEICNSWSFEYFDRIFQSIGSRPVEKRYLERDADNAGRGIVESNIGPVFTKSDGAVIFEGEKYGLHTRVFISSRGLTLYEARDLGLMKLKAEDFNPQASYIVTANEQKEYFEVILKAAELIMPEVAKMTRNISTGMVKLSTGKMSSRTGNAINIGWLIEAIKSALSSRKSSHEGQEQTIVGALRYSMLKNRIGSDLVFDVNDAISLEGNSGPYLQYAYARSRSILAKVTSESQELPGDIDKDERRLLRKLGDYQNVLDKAVSELLPHQLCGYLYELAQLFNQFYEHNRVLGDERENIRVNLVRKYSDILKSGLDVLGIPAPDRI